jgi:hypothetical protein
MDDRDDREIGQAYRRAEKLVAEKVGFLRHLLVYVLVNVLLIAINLATNIDFLWFLLVLAAWSVVLLAHYLCVFAFRGERFERWRRRQVENEADKLRKGG